MAEEQLRIDALDYHERPTPGKISVTPTKALANQRDLSLAYSPGVAYACTAIQHNPQEAARYTSRANLVAVITNGTAVLGLGNIGALAGKPVMEGKGCLFKKFAGIDVFDIEIAETDPDRFVEIVAALEPTFGGINLEDIKAPECFIIERKLRERMKIPVFHDDQHGTAIVAAAGVLNGLKIVGKDIGKVKLVCSGAGAAAIACLDLQVSLGLEPAQRLHHRQQGRRAQGPQGQARSGQGAVRAGNRRAHARRHHRRRRCLPRPVGRRRADAGHGEEDGGQADHPRDGEPGAGDPARARQGGAPRLPDRHRPIGLSEPGQQLALLPVHLPRRAGLRRDDDQRADEARGDPRARGARAGGALRAGCAGVRRGDARVRPRLPDPARVRSAADHEPRARPSRKAAMESGVATRPISRPRRVSQPARPVRLPVGHDDGAAVRRGEGGAEARDLRRGRGRARAARGAGRDRRRAWRSRSSSAARTSSPNRIAKLGLRLKLGENAEVVNVLDDPRYRDAWSEYYQLAKRKGVSRAQAMEQMRSRPTLIGAMLVRRGDADAMLCGTSGDYADHLSHVRKVIGMREGVTTLAAMQLVILPDRQLFVCDTHVNLDPTAEQVAEMTLLAAEEVQALRPEAQHRVAVAFELRQLGRAVGAEDARRARADPAQRAPDLDVEGEMRGDTALSKTVRELVFPDSRLKADANLLIMPNVDAANITYNVLRMTGRRRHHRRRPAARRCEAGAHHDAVVDGASDRQHDGGRGRRRRRAAGGVL